SSVGLQKVGLVDGTRVRRRTAAPVARNQPRGADGEPLPQYERRGVEPVQVLYAGSGRAGLPLEGVLERESHFLSRDARVADQQPRAVDRAGTSAGGRPSERAQIDQLRSVHDVVAVDVQPVGRVAVRDTGDLA